MKPPSGNYPCPKCGESYVMIRYNSKLDIINAKCETCEYSWEDVTADKKQISERAAQFAVSQYPKQDWESFVRADAKHL